MARLVDYDAWRMALVLSETKGWVDKYGAPLVGSSDMQPETWVSVVDADVISCGEYNESDHTDAKTDTKKAPVGTKKVPKIHLKSTQNRPKRLAKSRA